MDSSTSSNWFTEGFDTADLKAAFLPADRAASN